jgi:hypothetical protein
MNRRKMMFAAIFGSALLGFGRIGRPLCAPGKTTMTTNDDTKRQPEENCA